MLLYSQSWFSAAPLVLFYSSNSSSLIHFYYLIPLYHSHPPLLSLSSALIPFYHPDFYFYFLFLPLASSLFYCPDSLLIFCCLVPLHSSTLIPLFSLFSTARLPLFSHPFTARSTCSVILIPFLFSSLSYRIGTSLCNRIFGLRKQSSWELI